MPYTITILGSGTSTGVPQIGCRCATCTSDDPRDKRLRASALVTTPRGNRFLIDCGPDFRQQILLQGSPHLDGLLITHSHYDHVGGIDDLRPFCGWNDLPMYAREDVSSDLKRRLDYCFREHPYPGVPSFDMKVISNHPFYIRGLKVEPVEVYHGKKAIFGYRIGKFAYITDAKSIDEVEKDKLRGLDVLIVNALRDKEHFAHFTLAEALALIEEVKPREAYLTHFNHEIGRHKELESRLPAYVHAAFDGLKIEVE